MTLPPDEPNKADQVLRLSQAQDPDAVLRGMVQTTRQPFAVLDAAMKLRLANQAFLNLFEVDPEQTLGHPLFELGNGQWDIPRLRDLLEKILSQNQEVEDYRVEHEFPRIGRRVMLFNARRLPADDAERILVAVEDVTGPERLQAELVARQEFAEKLIDSLREAVLVLTPQLQVHSANRPFFDLFQVNPEDTLGRYVYDLGNGHWDIPALRHLLGEVLPGQNSFDDYEVEHEFEDIGWRRMSLNARRLDHLNLILLTIRDLTQEAVSARDLHKMQQRLHLAINAAKLGVFEWDAINEISLWFNDRMYQIFGRDGELGPLGMQAFLEEVLDPRDREGFDAAMAAVNRAAPEFHSEVRIRRGGDGAQRWIAFHSLFQFGADDEPRKLMGVVTDVTERKRAEAELRESEQRFRIMADGLPLIVWVHDARGRQQFVNRTFLEFFGVTEQEVGGDDWQVHMHPEDAEAYAAEFRRCNEQQRRFHAEVRVRDKHAQWRWLESWGEPRFDDNGAFLGIVGTSADVTERKAIEVELRQMQQELERRVAERSAELMEERNFKDAIFNTVTAIIVIFDADGMIRGFNRACERITGYAAEDVTGRFSLQQLIPAQELNAAWAVFERLRDGKEDPLRHENHWITRCGERVLISWSNTVLRGNDGAIQYIIGTGVDVTDQRRAEEEARQHLEAASTLQRLQTAHELATLLAHELNQPLGAIANYAETGLQQLNRGTDVKDRLKSTLERIAHQSLRAGQTIRSLREFVNRGHTDVAPVDLAIVVNNVYMLINPRARRHGIEISIKAENGLPQVMATEVQIEQVLLNLLRNAVEAIVEDGTDSGNITVEIMQVDDYIRVSVLDSGPGIDEDRARELFEPLSSTKQEGLGVGLSISRSLIYAHQGRIWAEPHALGGILHFELPVGG